MDAGRNRQSVTPASPMAGGMPISNAVADQAADWLTLFMSGKVTEEDRHRWQEWRDAHGDHERAWKHIEAVAGRIKLMEPKAAYNLLSPYGAAARQDVAGRRRAISLLLWGGIACATGVVGTRTQVWQEANADYKTGTGEQLTVALDDGTHITLNTASSINVRFDDQQRLIRLIAGEVMITTGHAEKNGMPDMRPFMVETAEGTIRALGTRFSVRQQEGQTGVGVVESAVEITLADVTGFPHVLQAGERVSFTRREIDMPAMLTDDDNAWMRGQIVAVNVRLEEFLADLARYRRGIVRCDPAVADLRLSGVFPLHDTNHILAVLPNVLPVEVTTRTRYWVTVAAR